ncbi:MAG: sulfatase [Bacteroidales bacterium]|nr:sulfatase [Bacteroidales bacterium]
MKKSVYWISGLFLLLIFSCNKTEVPPNILWIIAEDLSPDLGCYGNTVVSTPNLDQLAVEGTLFQNVYVTGPVCSASRSAMITGCYQTSIGAHNHRTLEEAKQPLPDSVHLITRYFNEHGYYTVLEGPKMKEKRKTPGPWGSGKTDYNFSYPKKDFFAGTSIEDTPKGMPFFAQLTLKQTHRGDWWDMGKPRNPTVDKSLIDIPPYYPDHPVSRESFAAYYDAINILDKQVGIILSNLDSLGIRDNTIVIFTADHGRPFPRGKQFCYEQGIHVPLIISGPGIEKGKIDDRLLSSLDLVASLLEIADIDSVNSIQGHDFIHDSTFERSYIVAARDRCDETVFRIRAVRTQAYKYIRNYYPERPYAAQNRYKDTNYPILQLMRDMKSEGNLPEACSLFMSESKPVEELYFLDQDPHELNNLAGNSEMEGILNEHRGMLEQWLNDYPDYGAFPEHDTIMEKIMIERIQKYGY